MDRVDPDGPLSAHEARRLYAPALPEMEAELELGADAAQHARVLRLTIGETVELFDGRGATVQAEVVSLDKRSLRCRARGARSYVQRATRVVLVQCLPKASKLDDIVRMTTELGVAEIALAISERCIARESEREEQRTTRLLRIAIEAARQSEQPFVPVLAPPRALPEVLARAPAEAFRGACLERSAAPFPLTVASDELWLVIGPEGGLSAQDRAALKAADFTPVALSRSILRTETAAVVGVGLAMERLGRRR